MTAACSMADRVERLVGAGWELGVFRQDGALVLGIPVESGHRSFGFEFAISAPDLAVLEGDAYRRKALDLILHERLQPRLTRGDHHDIEAEIRPIIHAVLHGPGVGIAHIIADTPNPGFIRQHLRAAGFSDGDDQHADGL